MPGSQSEVTEEEEQLIKQYISAMRAVPSPGSRNHYPIHPPLSTHARILCIHVCLRRMVCACTYMYVLCVVVVVTTSDGSLKRGMTCSSFTSVSLRPPIISFAMQFHRYAHTLILPCLILPCLILSCLILPCLMHSFPIPWAAVACTSCY